MPFLPEMEILLWHEGKWLPFLPESEFQLPILPECENSAWGGVGVHWTPLPMHLGMTSRDMSRRDASGTARRLPFLPEIEILMWQVE